MTEKVTHDEVVELLKRIGDGDAVPELEDEALSWTNVWCGGVPFLVDGWRVVAYNDMDNLHYIESVRAPDGREAEYEDLVVDVKTDPSWWWNEKIEEIPMCPLVHLRNVDNSCHERVCAAFEDVTESYTVQDCNRCPLLIGEVDRCGHPKGYNRKVTTDEFLPPKWCPLRARHLRLELAR